MTFMDDFGFEFTTTENKPVVRTNKVTIFGVRITEAALHLLRVMHASKMLYFEVEKNQHEAVHLLMHHGLVRAKSNPYWTITANGRRFMDDLRTLEALKISDEL